ncbi:otoraplin [Lepisosteus oculatus]|uniref:Otoraplin n=1 Tax=Lepisosteus oculatus TaxID=7918 RepID=W5NGD9_LEPOC|nr:PREDICTED: otoraplin [Lepisosteus oculatus]
MLKLLDLVFVLTLLGSINQAVSGVMMEKLANMKLCADEECSHTISLATANDDYNAPDCRFINIKKGQLIYVYSKLLPEEGSGEFWSGSVYSDRYVEQMGIIGYFPSTLVTETHVFKEGSIEIPTTDIDFYCV